MCISFLTTAKGIELPEGMPARPEHPDFVNMGNEVAFARVWGGEMEWKPLRFGLTPEQSNGKSLVTTATEEALETKEQWTRMIRQRCVIPAKGHRWSPKQDWVRRPSGWALGFWDTDEGGRAALISELKGEQRSLILVDAVTAGAWLVAKQWDALKVLRGAERLPVAMAA